MFKLNNEMCLIFNFYSLKIRRHFRWFFKINKHKKSEEEEEREYEGTWNEKETSTDDDAEDE